jgi:hypothetical protein
MDQLLSPVIVEAHDKLVFEIVDKGTLVSSVPSELLPIIVANLSRRRHPWLQLNNLLVVNIIQLRDTCPKEVRRAEDMRVVVVELKIVVDD